MAGFNWFKRQFNQDKAPEPKPQETQQKTPEPKTESKPEAPAAPTTPAAPTVNQDYLNWAKAAYTNIKQRQGTADEPAPAVEPTTPEPEEAAPEETAETTAAEPAAAESIAPDPEPIAATEVTEPEQPAAVEPLPEEESLPEASQEEDVQTSLDVDDEAGDADAEDSIAATQEPLTEEPDREESSPVSSAPVPEEPEESEEPEELTDTPSEPLEQTPTPSPDSAPAAESTIASETESPESATEPIADEPAAAPASLPFWARSEAERLERLERLKSEAIEEPEPEPVSTASAQPTTQPQGDEFELDENFLWSAEVLAAQGRRPDEVSIEEITWLKRLRQGLGKTRRGLVNQLRSIVGQGPLNQEAVMEIESLLLQADVGIEATDYIIEALQDKLRQDALPSDEAIAYLKQILRDMLDRPYQEQYSPTFAPDKDEFNIWLITGVNGAGKTTTIGKIAHLARKSEYRCLIAAADTFRAAAVEQVKVWGQRSDVEVIANPGKNTDPAAVVYDAIAAAKSRNTELLLVDTAGRLQNKKNLMEELSKIRRIIDKKAPDAKIESLLVLDSTLGQNGLRQAEVFAEAAKLSGVVLTKLDGTARGGIALAVVQQLGLPIRFIGAGEGIEDLRPFSSYEFVEALLNG